MAHTKPKKSNFEKISRSQVSNEEHPLNLTFQKKIKALFGLTASTTNFHFKRNDKIVFSRKFPVLPKITFET